MPQTLILRPRYLNGGLGQTGTQQVATVTTVLRVRSLEDLNRLETQEATLANIAAKFESMPANPTEPPNMMVRRDESGNLVVIPGDYTSVSKVFYKSGFTGNFAQDIAAFVAAGRAIGTPIISVTYTIASEVPPAVPQGPGGGEQGAGSGSGSGGQSANPLAPDNEKNEPKKDGDKWGAYLEMAKPYALPAAITLLALVLIFKSNGRR
jgi:hypothetical protein